VSRAWFKLYGRDYRDGVRELPWDVTGIYSVLLTLMYEEQGGRIKDHDQRLSRLIGCDIRLWRRAKKALVEAGKLHQTTDGFLTNTRVEIEQRSAEHLSEVRAISGRSSRQLTNSKAPKSRKTKEAPPANAPKLPLYARALPESEPDIPSTSLRSVEGETRARKRAAPKHPIAIDLPITEKARAFAAERGFLNGAVEGMWTHFTAYHAGKGTMTASVEASWRTWVMNQQKFQGERNGNGSGVAGDRGAGPRTGARTQPRSAASIIMERALADELGDAGGPPVLDLTGD
jgi:uncharacterized protein YdaU (DUF1376 family)